MLLSKAYADNKNDVSYVSPFFFRIAHRMASKMVQYIIVGMNDKLLIATIV